MCRRVRRRCAVACDAVVPSRATPLCRRVRRRCAVACDVAVPSPGKWLRRRVPPGSVRGGRPAAGVPDGAARAARGLPCGARSGAARHNSLRAASGAPLGQMPRVSHGARFSKLKRDRPGPVLLGTPYGTPATGLPPRRRDRLFAARGSRLAARCSRLATPGSRFGASRWRPYSRARRTSRSSSTGSFVAAPACPLPRRQHPGRSARHLSGNRGSALRGHAAAPSGRPGAGRPGGAPRGRVRPRTATRHTP